MVAQNNFFTNWIILIGFNGLLVTFGVKANGVTYKNCGGVFTEPKGVISTPSFPGPYPTPISCEWLIQAPHGKKIIIYFTQFYMKDSFYITEYEYYQDKTTYIGRHSLGRISWEHMLTSLAAYKPYVLIEFEVVNIGNRHLRVIDHLLEVYGFNITYEILDKSADVTKETCSVSECSFLGNCLVSGDFQSYKCNCFDNFFGDNCQYGPYCDPDNGINQCTNGGRCKYFFGSLINQCDCPPGFAGSYCEISEIPESANGRNAACMELQCSHLCDIDAQGKAYCMCYDGYKMHQDNGTCIPIARYRMDVSLDLYPVDRMSDEMVDEKLREVSPKIVEIIKENGVSTISKFGVKQLRRRQSSAQLEFYFYCKVSEIKLVKPALQALIDETQVGIFRIIPQDPSYLESPELMIAEVSNYNLSPAIRGELLTLVCAAKGSHYMTFQWYKDNHLVDTGLTLRNTWISIIPDTVHGMQLSVLNIDNVGPLDKGVFSCEVSDFGESQKGSVDVTVDNYPRVELSPMSLSVLKGEMVSIKCMSPDISWEKISYEWFKNGVKIDSKSRVAYAEDMNPAGVRLVVPEVLDDAEYTCKVTNNAGSANVSAYVSAISSNETHLICKHTFEGQIHWQNTSGGHFYIERCPTEQGDLSETIQIGYARRNCICDPETAECHWGEPNFAKCQSLGLIKVYDELQLLRSGYQQTTLKSVFDKLYLFTFPKKNVLIFSGDMDMVAHILKDFMAHLKNFPQLVNKDEPISAEKLIKLLSGMIQQSSTATPDEKGIILVGPCIIQTLATLFSGALKSMEYDPYKQISSLNVDMRTEMVNLVPDEWTEPVEEDQDESTEFIRYRREESVVQQEKIVMVESRQLSDLLSYRHDAHTKDKQLFSEIISPVYSAAFYNDKNGDIPTSRVEMTINHDITIESKTPYDTVCLSWVYDSANLNTGYWSDTSCTMVTTSTENTVCYCPLPGHFVVAMVKLNYTEPIPCTSTDDPINIPVVVGYLVSLFFLVVSAAVFLKACGQLVGDIYPVYVSFIWCLIAVTVTSLICLFEMAVSEKAQSTVQILSAFFYLAAQTHITLEAFTIFMSAYSITTVQLNKLRLIFICWVLLIFLAAQTHITLEAFTIFMNAYCITTAQLDKLKLIFICWGLPAAILIPIAVLSRTTDHSNPCKLICWFSTDMPQFYVYLVSTIFFILTFLVFISSSLVSFRHWKEEWRYADKIRYLKQIGKCSVIFLFLILFTSTSLNLKNSSPSAQIISHIVFHICLCISVLVFRCIFDKQIRFHFEKMCVTWERNTDAYSEKSCSSFRAFVKPEKVSNIPLSQEEYNVSKYYDEVNRTKYTAERKRHLSLLLGSSVGGESGYASVDTTKNGSVSNSNNGSKESALSPITAMTEDRASDNGGNDSGIYDFQEVGNVPVNERDSDLPGTSKLTTSRSRSARSASPNRLRLLASGASNYEGHNGLKPVCYQCYNEQNTAGCECRSCDCTVNFEGKISEEHEKSIDLNDLDQVIYYPCYNKKSSNQKSKSKICSIPSSEDHDPSTVHESQSEVSALIHATLDNETADDISAGSQLLEKV